MATNSDKMFQEIQFIDKSMFRGESFQDEESRIIFKEGQGQFTRPSRENMCYYNQIVGNWSRSILHGKRNEWHMNLRVFPKGYFAGYSKYNEKV